MGDIKKLRKKYDTPRHPWNATRIKLEKNIMRKYGVLNKKEIWKMESVLKSFKDQAKNLLTRTDEQANKERQQMTDRMVRLGLVKQGAGMDEILGLQLKDVMDRRLQTIVLKNHLARSIRHARQLITHEHIIVGGKKVTSPSYLVRGEEEMTVAFAPASKFNREGHPESFDTEVAQRKLARQKARAEKKGEEFDEIVLFDKVEDPDAVKKDDFDASVKDLKEEPAKKPAEKPAEVKKKSEKTEKKTSEKKAPEKKAEKPAEVPEKSEEKKEGSKTTDTPEAPAEKKE